MPDHFVRGRYRDEGSAIGPSLDAIEKAYDILLLLPEEDTCTFFTVEDHKRAADSGDFSGACLHLFWDSYNWLKFFWWTTAFKTRQLTGALVQAYNTDNLLAWAILGRSALEYAAVTHYFVKGINGLELRGPHFASSHIQKFEDLMLHYAHGTRFNWPDLFAGDRDALLRGFRQPQKQAAVNVLTAMKHLARRDERFRDVEIGYDMLSDFAHPNMASHATAVDMPAAPGEMHECHLSYQPAPLRREFLVMVTLPWVSAGVGAVVELLVEVAPLLKTWLGYIDGGAKISIDMRS